MFLFKGSDEMADTDKQSIFDQLAKPHANRLLQAFARIDHDGLRQSVVQLVEEIANNHSRAGIRPIVLCQALGRQGWLLSEAV